MRAELVGLDGGTLADLDRRAERRGIASWWRRLVAGLAPGATVTELLALADAGRRGTEARAFLASVGMPLGQLADEQGAVGSGGGAAS